jgi:hypothetical protein
MIYGIGKNISVPLSVQTESGAFQPPEERVPGADSPGVKQPVREADHSPASSAEAKNVGAMPPSPHTFS